MFLSLLLVVSLPSCVWSLSSVGGPKGSLSRRPRRSRTTSDRPNRTNNSPNNRRVVTNNVKNERSPQAVPKQLFDAKLLTQEQTSNEETASILDLSLLKLSTSVPLRNTPPEVNVASSTQQDEQSQSSGIQGEAIDTCHIEFMSLDSLFGEELNFSEIFAKNGNFREDIRMAVRSDIFHSTPAYADLSPKAAQFFMHPDSSLQGSWRCVSNDDNSKIRMTRLTEVLKEYLGENAPSGDDFMNTIGALCGPEPSTHWMDIIGVKDRQISHSWHQDTGTTKDTKTVMLGFPCQDNYDGTGVFSHAVKLKNEQFAPIDHTPNEPILYDQIVPDEYIIRPRFAKGRELLVYRDTHIIHSAPDVTFRSSIMRFM